ncbi:PspC domain-containing protein [Liquorilactobacillus aquaticus]|nr:PspC domain-containing protein [Liquorilactobacillus aquaticus]
MKKQLTKSNDKIFSGVFGGVAEYFNWDKTWTRIVGAILIIFPGNLFLGILVYVIAAIVMPEKNDTNHRKDDDDIIEGEFRE